MPTTAHSITPPCRPQIKLQLEPFFGQVSKVHFKNDILSFCVGESACKITGLDKAPEWLISGVYVKVDLQLQSVEYVEQEEYEAIKTRALRTK